MKTIFLSAGEPSGDRIAADLARALLASGPGRPAPAPGELRLLGMGGARMRAAGVEIVRSAEGLAVMGFVEVLRRLGEFRRLLAETVERLKAERPDALVLVDYPGFHLRLAAAARRALPDLKIVYYVAPQVWSWGASRARKLARIADRVLVIFEFEEPIWKRAGASVAWVGHPLLDRLDPADRSRPLREELDLAESDRLVALLPGSRPAVFRRHLGPFLGAAEILARSAPGTRFALAPAEETPVAPRERSRVEEALARGLSLALVPGRAAEALRSANLALVSSGTATLEAAVAGCPPVVAYRGSLLSYLLARMVVTVPYVSLVNLLAGRRLVPELLQSRVTPALLAREALALLDDDAARAHVREGLAEVVRRLGPAGASARAAAEVLAAIGLSPREAGAASPGGASP